MKTCTSELFQDYFKSFAAPFLLFSIGRFFCLKNIAECTTHQHPHLIIMSFDQLFRFNLSDNQYLLLKPSTKNLILCLLNIYLLCEFKILSKEISFCLNCRRHLSMVTCHPGSWSVRTVSVVVALHQTDDSASITQNKFQIICANRSIEIVQEQIPRPRP